MIRVTCRDLVDMAARGLRDVGFSEAVTESLARATLEAELYGKHVVGLSHLKHYFDAAQKNLINVSPVVEKQRVTPSMIKVDADGGPMQYAFTSFETDFITISREYGLAALLLNNTFAGGELGFIARRLARHGLMSICTANSPAVMSIGESKHRLLGTNPLSYGVPINDREGFIMDQASSATALATVEKLAYKNEPLPDGWAIDKYGDPTNDAAAALEGALLPFGSYKGANIALLVELLSMMSGAKSSLEAAPYQSGQGRPDIGVCIFAIDISQMPGFSGRIENLIAQFVDKFGAQLRKTPLFRYESYVDVLEEDWSLIKHHIEKSEHAYKHP